MCYVPSCWSLLSRDVKPEAFIHCIRSFELGHRAQGTQARFGQGINLPEDYIGCMGLYIGLIDLYLDCYAEPDDLSEPA